jgi:hypothetical protein
MVPGCPADVRRSSLAPRTHTLQHPTLREHLCDRASAAIFGCPRGDLTDGSRSLSLTVRPSCFVLLARRQNGALTAACAGQVGRSIPGWHRALVHSTRRVLRRCPLGPDHRDYIAASRSRGRCERSLSKDRQQVSVRGRARGFGAASAKKFKSSPKIDATRDPPTAPD